MRCERRSVGIHDPIGDFSRDEQRNLGDRSGAGEAVVGQPSRGVDEGHALGATLCNETGEQLDVGDGARGGQGGSCVPVEIVEIDDGVFDQRSAYRTQRFLRVWLTPGLDVSEIGILGIDRGIRAGQQATNRTQVLHGTRRLWQQRSPSRGTLDFWAGALVSVDADGVAHGLRTQADVVPPTADAATSPLD